MLGVPRCHFLISDNPEYELKVRGGYERAGKGRASRLSVGDDLRDMLELMYMVLCLLVDACTDR